MDERTAEEFLARITKSVPRGLPHELLEDARQEVAVRIWERFREDAPRVEPRFLRGVARNVARELLRYRAPARGYAIEPDLLDRFPSRRCDDPLLLAASQEECSRIASAVASLPNRYRGVVEWLLRRPTTTTEERPGNPRNVNAWHVLVHRSRRALTRRGVLPGRCIG